MDVFVLVACSENALVDTKEYLRPIATPFEAQMAMLPGREWTGSYSLQLDGIPDLEACFKGEEGGGEGEQADGEEMMFSLQSGTLIHSSHASSGVVMVSTKNPGTLINAPNLARISSRSWNGLELPVGETAASPVVIGRTGIASGYSDEK